MKNGICYASDFALTATHYALIGTLIAATAGVIILFLMKQEKWMFSKKSKTDEV